MPSFAVEMMTEADIPAIVAIDPATTETQLREEFGRPWSRRWVARDATGTAVAFLVAWHVADELHVLNVATALAHRRKGAGRALLDELVARAKQFRVAHVLLEVRRSNAPAITLYRSFGFHVKTIRARYYPDDEDALDMALVFDRTTGEVVVRPDEVSLD